MMCYRIVYMELNCNNQCYPTKILYIFFKPKSLIRSYMSFIFQKLMQTCRTLLGLIWSCIYMRSVQKVSSHVIWKIETFIEEDTRYKIQETLYIGQWCLSLPQNSHMGTAHSSSTHHQLPHCIFRISLVVWNLFPFKGDFSFSKSQKLQGAKSGL